jgi:tRNA1Val (adenine37-N6)-methyltransferase
METASSGRSDNIHRFVPVGSASLSADAPGWDADESSSSCIVGKTDDDALVVGPICWKCKGTGKSVQGSENSKKKQKDPTCNVCQGIGRLKPKKREREAKNQRRGEITQPRRSSDDWKDFGPLPYAVWAAQGQSNNETSNDKGVELWNQVQQSRKEKHIPSDMVDCPWIPRQGEQLCNLVGSWRILQCVGSHRWTTDDLVTAYVAAQQVEKQLSQFTQENDFHYLDLGCGNGSVLSMASWKLCQLLHQKISKMKCVGVEARKEAFELNERSLSFNMGYPCDDAIKNQQGACPIDVQVLHGDFRELENLLRQRIWNHQEAMDMRGKFDLVTGTPPYFRVDFKVAAKKGKSNSAYGDDDDGGDKVVEKAVINQGGMPTCRQSAPARCEFRGGIEAYCHAAVLAMKPDGIFVVCENWINDKRVHEGAKDAGLIITEIQPVKGNVDKPDALFAVYTMRKREYVEKQPAKLEAMDKAPVPNPPMIVRDEKGKWTVRYAKDVLEWMSIPAKHETDPSNRQS